MSTISIMPGEIAEWLSSQQELEGINFITEYPASKKPVPLKKVMVAVGIDNIAIEDSFVENDEGVLVENEYCRLASIKLRLGIHAPFAEGGARCHDVFTDVADCLTFATDLNISQSGCGKIKADRDTDAFVLEAWITVQADFCPAASSSVSFESFLNKELLCGSHISNSEIHFSPEEKERFLSPCLAGSYFGTGAATRSISLGFKPALVIAFARQMPVTTTDFAGGFTGSRFAIATAENSAMQGIEIISGGFRLLSGSSYYIGNSHPLLNEAGTLYTYLAFR